MHFNLWNREVLVVYVVHYGVELYVDAATISKDQSAAQTDLRSNTKSKMSPIEKLTLAIDKEGPFSEGDPITGTVFFILTKDTKIKSVSLKAKGEANVHWTSGDTAYYGRRTYFKVKIYPVEKKPKGKPENVKEDISLEVSYGYEH